MDSYRTARQYACARFTEKKSEFIGYIKPIETEAEALAFISETADKHSDATHNVYAYINLEGNVVRFSDDGEPQGTAGMPVLEVLNREQLRGVVVVVTRYFGGILLGAGGLVRAYARAAKAALDAAGVAVFSKYRIFKLDCEYSLGSKLKYELPRRDAEIIGLGYTDLVNIVIKVAPENEKSVSDYVADCSGGKVELQLIGEKYCE